MNDLNRSLDNDPESTPKYDRWEYFSRIYCPSLMTDNQEAEKGDDAVDYSATEIAQFGNNLKIIFEKVNLSRSQEYVRIFNGLANLEKKVQNLESKTASVRKVMNSKKVVDDRNQMAKATGDARPKLTYTRGDLKRLARDFTIQFDQLIAGRNRIFARIFADLIELEMKMGRVEQKMARYTSWLEKQRDIIRMQRLVIRDRQNQIDYYNAASDRYTCTICFDRDKDTAFNCGHIFCQECARGVMAQNGGTCPICREKISTMRQLMY